jgi:Flp pilus assembly protein TadB
MKNNLENYFKSYGVAGLAIAAAVLINVVAWVWAKEARSEYIQRNKELAALTTQRSSPVQIKRESEKIAAVRDRVARGFVSPEKIVDFIVFLEDSAKETGNSVSISSAEAPGQLERQ